MKKGFFILLMFGLMISCNTKKQKELMSEENIDQTKERDKTSAEVGPPSDNDFGALEKDSANTINSAEGLE